MMDPRVAASLQADLSRKSAFVRSSAYAAMDADAKKTYLDALKRQRQEIQRQLEAARRAERLEANPPKMEEDEEVLYENMSQFAKKNVPEVTESEAGRKRISFRSYLIQSCKSLAAAITLSMAKKMLMMSK